MLSRLSISNYALIENLDFLPGEGLSIITGETGAGKSVMISALALLKGGRADSKVITDTRKKSVVEAEFNDLPIHIYEKIRSIDAEWKGGEIIVRREISPSGRSRTFLNDSPVLLTDLADITKDLLDVHSQNSNSLLSAPEMQLELLDTFADNEQLTSEYRDEFRRYVDIRHRINELRRRKEELVKQRDIITFKLQQLDKLKPREGELKEVESFYESLSNSEELLARLGNARRLLEGDEESGVLGMISEATTDLQGVDLSLWGESTTEFQSRMRQCYVELKDMADTLGSIMESVDANPVTLQRLSDRMTEYYSALKYFNLETDAELASLRMELRGQLEMIDSGGNDSEALEEEAIESARILKATAAEISAKRREAALRLGKLIEEEARTLGLENLKFEISVTPVKLNKTGGDAVDFKASFNKNQIPVSVGKIASGGEVARLMLAIKKISSRKMDLPTIIFDEIDTGVSGKIADRMGEMMREMGEGMQIITITHLPQVAAKGNRHFKVYKEDQEEKTVSDIALLDGEERVREIAQMLSGEVLNEAALVNARTLLGDVAR